jgi:glycyl-tRNA synthetase beta subunit
MSTLAEDEQFSRFLTTYSRPARLVRSRTVSAQVDTCLFEQPEEAALWSAYSVVAQRIGPDSSLADLVAAFDELQGSIDAFFGKVFVMSDDPQKRDNRLALLANVASLANGIVDLTKVDGF